MLYAAASVILLSLRRLSPRALIVVGAVTYLLPVPSYVLAQFVTDNYNLDLAGIWTDPGVDIKDPVAMAMLFAYFSSGLGMILLGAGLYRLGFIQGGCSTKDYRTTAAIGLGIGLPLAALGVAFVVWNDFSREVAFIGHIPNQLGTIPASLGYMSVIVLWDKGGNGWLKSRLIAAGRMALTNYVTQTILGVLILSAILADHAIGRSELLILVAGVWVVQLWWSQAWLDRFRFGPAEWLWRVATYRRGQPLRQM